MEAVEELPLLERERELAAVGCVLDAARGGRGGVLLVEGPPGVGKTRVLAAARALAGDFRVLTARGSELEREFPFGVVRQLFEPVIASASSGNAASCWQGRPRWSRGCSRLPPWARRWVAMRLRRCTASTG